MTRFCEFVAGIQHVHPKFSDNIDSARPKTVEKFRDLNLHTELPSAEGLYVDWLKIN